MAKGTVKTIECKFCTNQGHLPRHIFYFVFTRATFPWLVLHKYRQHQIATAIAYDQTKNLPDQRKFQIIMLEAPMTFSMSGQKDQQWRRIGPGFSGLEWQFSWSLAGERKTCVFDFISVRSVFILFQASEVNIGLTTTFEASIFEGNDNFCMEIHIFLLQLYISMVRHFLCSAQNS